jgi:hypothetical protein
MCREVPLSFAALRAFFSRHATSFLLELFEKTEQHHRVTIVCTVLMTGIAQQIPVVHALVHRPMIVVKVTVEFKLHP